MEMYHVGNYFVSDTDTILPCLHTRSSDSVNLTLMSSNLMLAAFYKTPNILLHNFVMKRLHRKNQQSLKTF